MKLNLHKKLPVISIAILFFTQFFACMEERWIDTSGNTEEKAQVKVVIQSPGAGSTSSTRAITDTDEADVKRIDILVFEAQADGGKYVTTASCEETDITTDPTNLRYKTFTVTLTQGDFDLVILANAAEMLAGIDPENLTKSQVLAQLETAVPVSGTKWPTTPFTPFPMWGDIGEITIDDNTDLTGNNSVKMTRMVARVDVKLSGDALQNFHITSVDVYNYNTKGTLVPGDNVWNDTDFKVTAPTIPTSSTLVEGPLKYTGIKDDAYCIQEIYLFEAENHSDADHEIHKGLISRTCLVIGGIWDAGGTNDFSGSPGYYRVDFAPTGAIKSQEYYDILRNHHYTFTITKVTGAGYDDSYTAFKSAPVNIETEIIVWNEANMEDVWLDGQYYYSITPIESELWASPSAGNQINVKTDYPTWSFELSDLPTPGDPAANTANISWLSITSHTPGQEYTGNGTKDAILYDVERNTTGTSRVAYIHYSAGRFTTTVTITQYEWEIEDIWVDPTGDIGPEGETRTVTIKGVFSDINIRVRNVLEDILLDQATVLASNTQNSNTLDVPVLWKSGQATISFEYYDIQQAQWAAIRTDRQQGYNVDVATSHTDGDAIRNAGETFSIYVSGVRPMVYVRAIVEATQEVIGGPVQIEGGTNPDNTKSIVIDANASNQSRTIILQWSVDGNTWETISTGTQSGYDVKVTTSHTANSAITNTGQQYQITVEGFYPDVYVRAVVQNTETEVATKVTVDAGTTTNTGKSITVNANASWDNRTVEFQWSIDNLNWTPITNGSQEGYNPVVTTAHTANSPITNTGQSYQVTVSGYYPDIYVQGVVKGTNTVAAPQITVTGGTTTNTTGQVTVDANVSWDNRTVEFQWSGNGKSDWTPLTEGLQTGYAPVLSIVVTGNAGTDQYSVSVTGTGYAPALTLRAAVNNVQVSSATPTLAAGTTTQRTQTLTIPASMVERVVEIQYWHPQMNAWITFDNFTQPEHVWILDVENKRVVAKKDLTGLTWTEGMGIDPMYNTKVYNYNNDTGNFANNTGYQPTHSTGCAAYWEGSENHSKTGKGKWFMPSFAEMDFMMTHNNYSSYGIVRSVDARNIYYYTDAESTMFFREVRTIFYASFNSAVTTVGRFKDGTSSVDNPKQERIRCVRYQ